MVSIIIDEIKKTKPSFSIDINELNKLKKIIKDKAYLNFLESTNGGGILNNSLKFYGVLANQLDFEIFYNNFLFKRYFNELVEELFVFAEDAFGNQYGFLKNGKVVLVNIETAAFEFTLENFEDFAQKLFEDIDYFTGFSIMENWIKKHGLIDDHKRLCPKKPFIVGGGYEIENFYVLGKEDLFDFNSYLAKQIKDLPEGTEIQFKID